MRIKDYNQANNIHPNDVLIIDGPEGTRTASRTKIIPEIYEAEAWANGTMDGVDVPSQHRAYHNNAKYHAQNSAASATSANASKEAAALSETNAEASATSANASKEAAETSATSANASKEAAATSATSANASKEAAAASAASIAEDAAIANQNALKAEGLAVGEQNGTPVDPSSPYYNNSAKHWADIAKQYGTGGVHYKAAVNFADIPTSEMVVGDMYDIKDDFVTDSRFQDGPGIPCDAGTNIIWNVNDKWDIDIQGGGSGGHTIINESGIELTQRSKLQFKGANVSDDETNDRTVVECEGGLDANIVAPVEVSPSAHAYNKGDQLIYDDKLYTVTKYIAIGDEIVKDSFFEPKTWNVDGAAPVGDGIWTDGDNIYFSGGTVSKQYVLDKATSTWIPKTWNGFENPSGIWTDGENIYCSVYLKSGVNLQYVLDKATSTWNEKIWNGFNELNGYNVWTDGENIYYSDPEGGTDGYQFVLDKSTSTWSEINWNYSGIYGTQIWSDGENIYCSYNAIQLVFNKNDLTWSDLPSGLIIERGEYVWNDGANTYYSRGAQQLVLDKVTSTWKTKEWSGLTNFIAHGIWHDGENIYYSYYVEQYVLISGNITLSDPITDQITENAGKVISYAEYQQLTPEQQANGDYYIPDYPSQPGYADNAPREGSQAYVTSDGLNRIIGTEDISDIGTTINGAIANLGSATHYSTAEQWTGKYWIDGKKIYQKTLTANSISNIGSCTFQHGISNFGELIDHNIPIWYDSVDKRWQSGFRLGPDYSIGMGSVTANSTTVQLNNDSHAMNVVDWSTRTNSVRVTIWYTKTTD